MRYTAPKKTCRYCDRTTVTGKEVCKKHLHGTDLLTTTKVR